jgi:hypothetical protein
LSLLIARFTAAWRLRSCRVHESKIADVGEHPGVFAHVGLLVNEPPGTAGLPFI